MWPHFYVASMLGLHAFTFPAKGFLLRRNLLTASKQHTKSKGNTKQNFSIQTRLNRWKRKLFDGNTTCGKFLKRFFAELNVSHLTFEWTERMFCCSSRLNGTAPLAIFCFWLSFSVLNKWFGQVVMQMLFCYLPVCVCADVKRVF